MTSDRLALASIDVAVAVAAAAVVGKRLGPATLEARPKVGLSMM